LAIIYLGQMKRVFIVYFLIILSYVVTGQRLSYEDMESRRILLDSIGFIEDGTDLSKITGQLLSVKQIALLTESAMDRYDQTQVIVWGNEWLVINMGRFSSKYSTMEIMRSLSRVGLFTR
jgi:hypothetical protein